MKAEAFMITVVQQTVTKRLTVTKYFSGPHISIMFADSISPIREEHDHKVPK